MRKDKTNPGRRPQRGPTWPGFAVALAREAEIGLPPKFLNSAARRASRSQAEWEEAERKWKRDNAGDLRDLGFATGGKGE